MSARPWTLLGCYIGSAVLVAAVVAPLGSWLVSWLVRASGQRVVANEAMVGFFLSPAGLIALLVAGVAAVVASEMGRASAMMVVGMRGLRARDVLWHLTKGLPVLSRLVGRELILAAWAALPFAAAIGVIAWLVLHGVDKNYLIHEKPPRFWWGLAGAAFPAAGLAFVVMRKATLWTIAVPLCVLEGRSASAALKESAAEMKGRLRDVFVRRAAWQVLVVLVAGAAEASLAWGGLRVLDHESGGLTGTALIAGAFMLGHLTVSALAGFAAISGDGIVSWLLYQREHHAPEEMPRETTGAGWLPVVGAGVAIAGLLGAATWIILRDAARPLDIIITAHRGGSRVAPENTVAAIRAAAELGADWAEIDVQLTSDKRVIVAHDSDLLRIAKDPRKVADITLEEIQKVDAGSWKGEAFKGERVPTLEEVVDAAVAGKLGLNIELKPVVGGEAELAARTIEVLQARGALERCVLTSLSTMAIVEAKKVEPRVRTGQIISAVIGRPAALGTDMFALNTKLVSGRTLGWGKGTALGVHAWTVNDPDQMTRLALRGVRGVITDDVEAMVKRRDEWKQLTDLERLLLAVRAYWVG